MTKNEKTKKITTLTVETERTFIFRCLGAQHLAWCLGCGAEVQMATVAEAARVAGLSELAVYQLIDDGLLHFAEDSERRVLICLNSLCLTLCKADKGSVTDNSNQKGERYERNE